MSSSEKPLALLRGPMGCVGRDLMEAPDGLGTWNESLACRVEAAPAASAAGAKQSSKASGIAVK